MLAEKGLGLLAPMGPLAEAYRLGLISVRTTATILQDGMASTTARSLVADLLARLDTLPVSAATLSLWQVALLTHFTGRLDGTTELVEKFARLADQLPRHEGALGRAVAHNALGINALHFGRLADSADHFGRTIESLTGLEADVVLLRDPRAEAWSYLCLVAATLGRQQQEAAANREVDALIARGPDLITFGMGRWFQVYAHYFRSDAERAFVVASESVTLLESRRASPFLQPHRIGLGWAMAALGRKQEGAALAADGLKRYKEQGSKQGLAGLHAVVAETHRLAGLQDEMTQYVGDGLAAANQGGDGFATSELHRLHGHGEVAPAAADKAFRQALAAAQAQGASLMEARAALSLRDRLVMDGRKKEAAQLLQSMRARLSHLSDVPVVAALMSG